jgi:hypothetical protein
MRRISSGSGYNTGRITGVAAAPNGDVYAAGAGGGVWRSTDSAHQQWTPVFDTQQTTSEGALAVIPAGDGNPSHYTVYAGTGEPTINLDSYAGVGTSPPPTTARAGSASAATSSSAAG